MLLKLNEIIQSILNWSTTSTISTISTINNYLVFKPYGDYWDCANTLSPDNILPNAPRYLGAWRDEITTTNSFFLQSRPVSLRLLSLWKRWFFFLHLLTKVQVAEWSKKISQVELLIFSEIFNKCFHEKLEENSNFCLHAIFTGPAL